MNTRKRKKEMLISLRNEITSLERTIDNSKLANLKIKGIKNYKLLNSNDIDVLKKN